MGLPKQIQHDHGSNFMSKVFGEVMQLLGIEQMVSSPYHPQSQGAIERHHQTLKTMIKTYCHDNQDAWDKGIQEIHKTNPQGSFHLNLSLVMRLEAH